MMIEHGTFQDVPFGGGWINEDGLNWATYVMGRVDYGPLGELLALYEDGTKADEIAIGTRYFFEVRNGAITFVTTNPSALSPGSGATVVETDQKFDVGMLYANGEVSPAPPPPVQIPSTRMVDVWLRSTPEEASLIQQGIATADARDNGLITATMRFAHDGEPYRALKVVVEDVLGAERAAVILAPSET